MTQTAHRFEDRLLVALLDRFDDVAHQSQPAVAPVPRRAAIRRYAVPLAGLAAAATAGSLTLVELNGPAPATHGVSTTPGYALAAWTPKPSSASPAQISGAESYCSASLGQVAQPGPGDKQGPTLPGGPESPVLVDTRGDLTLALYSNGSETTLCLASPSFVSLSPLGTGSASPVTSDTASLDKVTIRGVSGDAYTVAVGRTGSSVTGVALQRADGSQVTATVGHGHFIAWWPEAEGVKALAVTTNTGTQDYPVDPSFARSNPQPDNKVFGPVSGQPNSKSG